MCELHAVAAQQKAHTTCSASSVVAAVAQLLQSQIQMVAIFRQPEHYQKAGKDDADTSEHTYIKPGKANLSIVIPGTLFGGAAFWPVHHSR